MCTKVKVRIKQVVATFLAAFLVIGIFPVTSMAYSNDPNGIATGVIREFVSLDASVAHQAVLPGSGLEMVYLPQVLLAKVTRSQVGVLEYQEMYAYPDADMYLDDYDAFSAVELDEILMEIPVEWYSSDFDGDTEGEYTFIPIISADFELATYPPVITVAVVQDIDFVPIAAVSWDGPPVGNNSGLRPVQFSGRLGEWSQVQHATANYTFALRSMQAIQQDYNLYVAVHAQPGLLGDWTLFIDNGGFGSGTTNAQLGAATGFQRGANIWRNTRTDGMAHVNNRITHRVREASPGNFVLDRVASGTGTNVTWEEVTNSGLVVTRSATGDFLEIMVPLPSIGFDPTPFATSRFVRLGFDNGDGRNFLPVTTQSMLIVEAGWDHALLTNWLNHVETNLSGNFDPTNLTHWLNPTTGQPWMPPIATSLSDPTNNVYMLSDLYAVRIGNRLYVLYFGMESLNQFGWQEKLWFNTDYDQFNGRLYGSTFGGSHPFVASGNDLMIQGDGIHFQHSNAWDGLFRMDGYDANRPDVSDADRDRARSRSFLMHGVGGADFTPFTAAGHTPGEGRFHSANVHMVDMDEMAAIFNSDARVREFLGGTVISRDGNRVIEAVGGYYEFADIITMMVERERTGHAMIPMNGVNRFERNSAFVAIPHLDARYNFSMTGNRLDWANVGRTARIDGYPGGGFDLRATVSDEMLYVIVEGNNMNTQNVFFIGGPTGGFTRHSRPNVHYVVSGDLLYRVTGNSNAANAELVAASTFVNRVRIEYFEDHVMLKIHLSDLGLSPSDIRISWFGKDVVSLPFPSDTLLPLGNNSFTRFREDGVFYPTERFDVINANPLRGHGGSFALNPGNATAAHLYITWRDLEPHGPGPDFANVRQFVWNQYPNTGGLRANDAFINWSAAGQYVNLRLVLDMPQNPVQSGYTWQNFGTADIPFWLIEEMRANPINPRTGRPYVEDSVVLSPLSYMHAPGSTTRGGYIMPEGVWYDSRPSISGGTGLNPRYEHHLMIYHHERLVNAIAEEISRPGSPWNAVANIQLGSIGHWGEFHTWPTENSGGMPPLSITEVYVTHWLDAFADNDNIQFGMRYAYPIAARNRLGMFHDEHGMASTFAWVDNLRYGSPARFSEDDTGRTQLQFIEASRNTYWWKYGWSGGEWGDGASTGDGGVMNTMRAIRLAHTTSLTPRGPTPNLSVTFDNIGTRTTAKNMNALHNIMGYRYFIESFAVRSDDWDLSDPNNPLPVLQSGAPVAVEMVVHNQGVAPFYRPWPLEVSFVDGDTVLERITIPVEDVDIRTWMPRYTNSQGVTFEGRTNVNFTFDVPETLAFGQWDIAIGIVDPLLRNYEPAIIFAMEGEIGFGAGANGHRNAGTRRYRMDSVYVVPPRVIGVELDYNVLVMEPTNVFALAATVLPTNAANQGVVWVSTNPTVASVNQSGVVTALNLGTATIMVVTIEGGYTDAVVVTVVNNAVNVVDVALYPQTLLLRTAETYALEATVTPNDATVPDVVWTSSNRAVATVDENGVVTAVSPGIATITVRTLDGNHTAYTEVTVPITVTGVALNLVTVNLLSATDFRTLVATVFPLNATDRSVTWESSNPSVVSVTQTGLSTARVNALVSVGSATITVTTNCGGYTASILVTVGGGAPPREFGLLAFNNGTINNASLADAGLIRIWTQLSGVSSLVPYNDLVVTAVFPNGECAMGLVRINQPWGSPGYVNSLDVNFREPWQYIYLTAILSGQIVELRLINPEYVAQVVPVFSLQVFNNGTINNASLGNGGIIRMWTRLDEVNALVSYSGLGVTAVLPNGACAMEFVRINQVWNDPGNVNLIDVNFHAPWQRIYFTATYLGQTIELTLVNPR